MTTEHEEIIDSTDAPAGARLRSKLRAADILQLGGVGLRTRPLRAVLSALGIAIGIAAMIAVVGISTSSQAQLNTQLEALGTNLLTAEANTGMLGEDTKLPESTIGKARQMLGAEGASGTAKLSANVYRSELINESATGGITVLTADLDLLDVTATRVASGAWLNASTGQFPAVVLGATAAGHLGVHTIGTNVWMGGQYFAVVGILEPSALAPELDLSALVGEGIARSEFEWDGSPSTVYQRVAEDLIEQVRELLPATVNPQAPEEVAVSRPSDALAAKSAVDQAFTGLLVGLGSIALLVGGIGVANTMIISVLERRREIGLRRALGATRAHIRAQFLAEALLLSALGGVMGSLLGVIVVLSVGALNGWPFAVPPELFGAAVGSTLAIGAIAGLYPAARAARTPPTAALSI
ncbi:putative ABC transport system permease protein [Microbacterium phyllosphaerae]|uniref:ABC transport system permease protein n=1 Tax=Microbacterium phyllosphaerae TaxID=124798 RepID=A0ABS4WL13_9MICO|nr:ABC transporter permease [Microbacterium phyllosphaerae]MBP2376895.1 putative ABC transport system permease protein [Microbacterium phyllosphaerae]